MASHREDWPDLSPLPRTAIFDAVPCGARNFGFSPDAASLGRSGGNAVNGLLRHYLEMVAAMAAGMVAYAVLYGRGVISREITDEAVMILFMSVPMIAFMRYRGHSWRSAAEMTASMTVPAMAVFVALAPLPDVPDRALAMLTHVAMLLGMLALMLVRRVEYSHAGHH